MTQSEQCKFSSYGILLPNILCPACAVGDIQPINCQAGSHGQSNYPHAVINRGLGTEHSLEGKQHHATFEANLVIYNSQVLTLQVCLENMHRFNKLLVLGGYYVTDSEKKGSERVVSQKEVDLRGLKETVSHQT